MSWGNVIAGGAAILGGALSKKGGDKQAKAAQQASQQAADAAAQELAFQREARDDARAQLTPYSREGAVARRMYNAAMGVDTMTGGVGGDTLAAARADYDRNFEASPFMGDARYGAEQALNALRSTNAAMGRGSAINSGKALRAASDIEQGYRAGATQNYLNSLSGIVDTGMQADSGIASGGQVFADRSGNAIRQAAALQGQYGMMGAQAEAQGFADAAGFIGYGLGNYQRPRASSSGGVKPIKPFSYKTPTYSGKINSAARPLPALRGGG